MTEKIIFKRRRDGLILLLDAQLPFSELKEAMRLKVMNAKSFLGEARTCVSFAGRALTEREQAELLDILQTGTDLTISLGVSPSVERQPPVFTASENLTFYHHGSLRSGPALSYKGSIVVMGDVNPGSEVIAEGNVVVVGRLQGMVHAGSAGNMDCFVVALQFKPSQIRIGDILTYISADPPVESKTKGRDKSAETMSPSRAFVKDGQIYVAPLQWPV